MKISVVICTYNPRDAIFARCIDAISKAAIVHPPQEIIIIDNNSTNGFASGEWLQAFAKQYPVRIVVERKQGLTHARLRGIREASADILAFVDDDNIISDDFFQKVNEITEVHPNIGAFSGQVLLEYDAAPPAWTKRYWGMLVHREFTDDNWSNVQFDQSSMPCGAGLCVKKEVALHYLNLHEKGMRNFYLDRSADSLLSGGDNDLAMCACDIGLDMGLFASLKVQHYIPGERFTLKYLEKLTYGIYYSEKLLKYMRLHRIERTSLWKKMRSYLRSLLMKPNDGKINRASLRGANDAVSFLDKQI